MSSELQSSEGQHVTLEISQIRLDGGTQLREKADSDVVQEYAEQTDAGAVFPRVIVLFDGQNFWLADGFHRLEARKLLKLETIDCLVYEGSQRDAILVSVQANATHGLRRTNADKRRAVRAILADEEWSMKSTRWIARTCGVGQELVEAVRRELPESCSSPAEGVMEARLGMDGKIRNVARSTAAATSEDASSDPIEAALGCAGAFDLCLLHLRRVAAEGERLAKGPGGKFFNGIRLTDFRSNITQAFNAIAATRPSDRCGGCRGAGCERCEQAGWICPGKQRLY